MNYLRHIFNIAHITAFYQNNSTMDNEDINVIVSLHRCYQQFIKQKIV